MSIQQLGNRDIYLKFDDSYLEGLHAVQGETGRTYTFTLLDGEGRLVDASPYTLTMTVSIKGGINQSKARGTSDGKFTVAITPDMIARYGRADMQLTISDDNRTLASLIGNLEIERNISFDDGEGINLLLDFAKVKQTLDSLGGIREEANKSLNETIQERDKACECATKACECASVAQDGAQRAEKVREEADDIFSSETDRKAAENKRVEAENLRADSESTRQSQESTRKSQEVTRQSQEQGRNSAESVRQEAEDKRKLDEDTRARQERTRESQEDTRKLQESERESQEALRQDAEKSRVSAEDLRKEAEIERASTFATWDKAMEGVIPPATNTSPGVVKLDKAGEDTAVSKGSLDDVQRDVNSKASQASVDSLRDSLDDKVDKVEGKGLSTYDYNDSAKAKVDAIPDDPKYTDTTYDLTPYAKKTEIKTKLSEMEEDSTHRTVTDAEKSEWNNKVDKVSDKGLSSNDFTNAYKSKLDGIESEANKYTHPTSHPISMISGLQGELNNKIERASRSATFVIANHDSSENSKDGADYVVGIDDEFPDVLESCIGKLPSYGGKIVLTEGNFIVSESKNITIDRPGVTIEGYGRDVTKIKKVGGSGALIGINSDCCSVDRCAILNDDGGGMLIRGNRTSVRNCTILTRTNSINTLEGITDLTIYDCEIESIENYPPVVFKGSYLKMLACKVKSLLSNPILLQEMSKNGMVILCSFEGESYLSLFKGDNHLIMGNSFTGTGIGSGSATNSLIFNNLTPDE